MEQRLHHINSPKRNKSKLLLSCRGEKPFNLQNKLSESEIELDILAHFSPLISFHALMKNVTPALIKEIFQSVQRYQGAISFFLSVMSHFIHIFDLRCILTPEIAVKCRFVSEEKMISEESLYLAQLANQKSSETDLTEVLK